MKKMFAPLAATAVLTLASCGSSTGDSAGTTTPAASTDAPTPGSVDLSGVCPATVILQTDWNPEAEHGFLYQLLGPDYQVDTSATAVRGDLVAAGGPTGVKVEIRSGGPAIGYQQVTAELYTDPDIMLGFVGTAEAISHSSDKPTKAVVATFAKDPQVIMWDPATYPGVKTIADLKDIEEGVKIRYRDGVSWVDYLLQKGIVTKKQLDGTYDGTAAAFVAAGGKEAQQGYGTSEPYYYEKVLKDWMKPIAYQYIHETGWTSYAQSLAGTPEGISKNAACLAKLVPLIQQAQIDYVRSPAAANAVIVDAVNQFSNGWAYDAGQAAASAAQLTADSIVADSPDGTLGSFDMDRVAKFVQVAVPVFDTAGYETKKGLTAADIVTNEFIDPTISLG